jgi:hypothetical protein
MLLVSAGVKTSAVKGEILRFLSASKTSIAIVGMNALPTRAVEVVL